MVDPQDVQNISKQEPSQAAQAKSLQEAATDVNLEFKERAIEEKAKASGKYGYVDIARTPINPDLFHLVKADQAEEAKLIPFFRLGKKLRIAVTDPEDAKTKSLIDQLTSQGYQLQINLASPEGIHKALEQFHYAQAKDKPEVETEVKEDELEAYQKEIENIGKLAEKIQVSSAKEGLNLLELGAVKTGASDIHFQPQEKTTLVRFRIDGILQNVATLPNDVYAQLAQQIKYDAGMKLNVADVPQDGRFSFIVNERRIDVRVSALPSGSGETLVLRILDSSKKFGDFDALGFSPRDLNLLQEVSALAQGMILVTGPTGSGKTTTLYSLLQAYNTPERKIITLEDPIEYQLPRIVQSQINEKKGYTFASGLESVLRQDPDVVMIGEIRDFDTAQTAVQAALTGHVMLSTLHTNSALESIPRLVNMGLEPFMIAPALDTLIAQRLVRTFCPHCVKESPVSAEDKAFLEEKLAEISVVTGEQYVVPEALPEAQGCEECNHTGYLGRLVIAEMVRVTDEFLDLILSNARLTELKKKARELGMIDMFEDGIVKVIQKQTSLEEVRRVTA